MIQPPEIDRAYARKIIETVGGEGIPPQCGYEHFTAGLDPYLDVLDEEYLSTFIKDGGAVFKLVIGPYGGGKTHFLYSVRGLAWKHDFAVAYVPLSPTESPFHSLDRVLAAIMRGLAAPLTTEEAVSGWEEGFPAFLKRWFAKRTGELRELQLSPEEAHAQVLADIEAMQVESVSFRRAVRAAIAALIEHNDSAFDDLCQWLLVEGHTPKLRKEHSVLQKIDQKSAPSVLRSLTQMVRQMGFSGLVLLFDEVERMSSMSSKQRDKHLSNLRELIDECGHTTFQGTMLLFAVPDKKFLEGRTQIYEALSQRVSTIFDELNTSGVCIELDRTIPEPVPFLEQVGGKLAGIYQVAYGHEFDGATLEQAMPQIAEEAYEERFGDTGYKRLFVQRAIRGLHYLRKTGKIPPSNQSGGD